MAENIEHYISLAQETAVEAGQLLKQEHAKIARIKSEQHHDIKIDADTHSERLIIEKLESGSSFSILSEEKGFIARNDEDKIWIIDPLDGSINYLRQIPICCVSIALWENDKPVFGVIYDFNNEHLYSGVPGSGAWRNDQEIRVSVTSAKEKALLSSGFPSQANLSDTHVKNVVHDIQSYRKLRFIGSAAMSLAYVASGKVDVYKENNIMIWDVAAGLALVEAAGGNYTLNKTEIPHAYNVFASNHFIGE